VKPSLFQVFQQTIPKSCTCGAAEANRASTTVAVVSSASTVASALSVASQNAAVKAITATAATVPFVIAQPAATIPVTTISLQPQPLILLTAGSGTPMLVASAPVAATQPVTPPSQLEALDAASDGVDIDEFRDLVRTFKEKRVALGLTQTQVGRDFETLLGSEPYSQTQICRIERLDITPSQAKALEPILQKWLAIADQRYCYLSAGGTLVPVMVNRFVEGSAIAPAAGKRRQPRTQFSPETLAILNKHFVLDPTPNAFRIGEVAKEAGLEEHIVKVIIS
jgi:class 6 POU domain transcription factor